jgi:hypothetical protein
VSIRELIDAVEAGTFPHGINGAARVVFPYAEREANDLGLTAAAAFDGSLDAALALMQAVLPGWRWELFDRDGARIWESGAPHKPTLGEAENPARALLLAILKAMEAAPTQGETP